MEVVEGVPWNLADLAFPRLRERLSRRHRGKEEESPTATPDSDYSTAIIPQRREGLEGDRTPSSAGLKSVGNARKHATSNGMVTVLPVGPRSSEQPASNGTVTVLPV